MCNVDLLYSPSILNLWLLCSWILYVSWISKARLNLSTWIPQQFIKSTEKIRLLCYVKDIRGAPLTREVSLHRIQGHQWPVSEYPSSPPPPTFLFQMYMLLNFIFFSFIFISWRLITLQYCSGFCHTLTWISHGFTCVPHPETPSHLPPHLILWIIPVHQPRALVSCIQPGLAICITPDNIHILMLFSQIIPPSPSPTESKSLFYTSVSLFLSCI